MSPSRFHRVPVTKLALVSIVILLVAVALVWTTGQQAGASASRLRTSLSSAGVSIPDKSGITPAGSSIVVNSTSDAVNNSDGLCTLREAIIAANNNAASGVTPGECAAGSSGSDAITFTVVGTINLNGSNLPNISSDMTITGPGSSQLIIHRNTGNPYRILNIDGGTVSLSGLTATGGQTPVGASGAGISNSATLTMTDVTVTANETVNSPAGGIFNQGNLTMTNC
jgi:CSLREA domain-containing protein